MAIVCLIVSIQLFNLSFDPADPFCRKENLSVNEIESCLELILEVILGRDDAVKETDEADEAPDRPGSALTLFAISELVLLEENKSIENRKCFLLVNSDYPDSPNLPITSPPPKA